MDYRKQSKVTKTDFTQIAGYTDHLELSEKCSKMQVVESVHVLNFYKKVLKIKSKLILGSLN